MTKFRVEKFVENLTELLQAFILSTQESVIQAFDKFINLFQQAVNKHAPLKQASRKEKKRIKSKLWL